QSSRWPRNPIRAASASRRWPPERPPVSVPLTERSALSLAAAIRAQEISAREVVDAHLALIEQVNPRINAIVVPRFEAAREEASAADARIARASDDEDLPPL